MHYPGSQVNSAPVSLVNGILGGWATVNGVDFATYQATSYGPGIQGVVALGGGNYQLTATTVNNSTIVYLNTTSG